MAETYKITLTGTQDPVSLDDLGIKPIAYNPPTSNDIDLIASYGLSVEEINESEDFFNNLISGHITAETPEGTTLNSSNAEDFKENLIDAVLRRDNIEAITNPTINDDASKGYTIGSLWINTLTNTSYRCADNTTGSAVWILESNEALDWNNIQNKPSEFPPEDHLANKITNFDTEVSNNTDVSSNTTHRGRTDNPHNTTASQVGIDDTDDVNEGSSNLYYTENRVNNNTNVSSNTTHRGRTDNPHNTTASQVGIDDTDDINEGSTNLYYTETRVNNNTNVSSNTTHRGRTDNPHNTTKNQIGLGNVDNVQQIPLSQKGANNGVAELDGTGKVPASQLPAFVDDVQEYANLASFPTTGETGKIYIALDTGKTYRWSGSAYTEISSGDVNSVNGQIGVVVLDTDDISEGSSNLYYTETRVSNNSDVSANTTHRGRTDNPHNTTASQIGIDDTDDVNEGSSNLYYTETRVSNNSDVSANTTHRGRTDNPHNTTASQVGIDDTDDINEGSSNLYYNETRVNNNANVSANTTHRGRTDNPHSVSPAQVGNTTAQWNANQIQGVDVDDTDIADRRVLQYNSTSGNLEYEDLPSAEPVPAIQVRRTTAINNIPQAWTDITFDTIDVENKPEVVERDDINTDRVLIKSDGLYELKFEGNVDDECEVRFRVNDSIVVDGSTRQYGNTGDAIDLAGIVSSGCLVELTSGDFVSVQIQANSTAENLFVNSIFIVKKLEGTKGEKGDAGSGTSINIKQNDSSLGTFDTIDFGVDFEMTDEGGGEVRVNLPDTKLVRNFYVSVNGNDTIGNGSITEPFASITACISYITVNFNLSSTENAVIIVSAGEFTENTINLPRFCSIEGIQYRTRIISSSANQDLIVSQGAHTIKNLLLTGVSNPLNYLIRIDATQSTRVTLQNLSLSTYEGTGTISNGVYVNSSSGTITVRFKQIDFDDHTGTCITLDNNAEGIMRGVEVFDCSSATFLLALNNSKYSVSELEIQSCAIGIDHQNTGVSSLIGSDLFNVANPISKSNNAEIRFINSIFQGNKAGIQEVQGLKGTFLDLFENDEKFRLFDELSVGVPGQGRESCFGEGDSYVNGLIGYSFDGSSFSNISVAMKSGIGSTFTFPNGNAGTAIYLSTQRFDAITKNPIKWFGIKTKTITASVGGEIVLEYWNGSTWVEFNHMSTDSTDGAKYLPYGLDVFQRTGNEHVRYNSKIDDNWTANDPVSLGTDLFWIRFRIESNLTTVPVFEQWKIHTNRTEINSDGFIEYFGKARSVNILPFDSGTFQAGNNSPANQDIYIGDFLGVGRIENNFQSGAIDRIGLVRPLPLDLDTSCPINLRIIWQTETGDTTSDFNITVRWSNTNDGDPIYEAPNEAPSTALRQKTLTQTITNVGESTQFSQQFLLDVSDFTTRNEQNVGDLLWITIERNNDGNSSDLHLVQVEIQYIKWSNGGHL
jgi:hypothetical protein